MFKKRAAPDQLGSRIQKVVGEREPEEDMYLPDGGLKVTRGSERKAMFRQAEIKLPGGERIPVAVKDLSEGGVKIESFRMLNLPDVVEFYEAMSGRRTRARVVWQEDMRAALQFID